MRAVDVVLRELERVAEGVIHVRLRREVQDGVDFLLPQDVRDHVRRANVALHELRVGRHEKKRGGGRVQSVIFYVDVMTYRWSFQRNVRLT